MVTEEAEIQLTWWQIQCSTKANFSARELFNQIMHEVPTEVKEYSVMQVLIYSDVHRGMFFKMASSLLCKEIYINISNTMSQETVENRPHIATFFTQNDLVKSWHKAKRHHVYFPDVLFEILYTSLISCSETHSLLKSISHYTYFTAPQSDIILPYTSLNICYNEKCFK